MKHLLQTIRRKPKGACGKEGPLSVMVKFDLLHVEGAYEVDCLSCLPEVLRRLKQKRDDLATNAVAIHNKQILINEALQRYEDKE